MRTHLALAVALALPLAITPQQKPNLSGTWVATKDAPGDIAAAPSPIFGPRFAIVQDATHATILRVGREGPMGIALPLDGTEVKWRAAGGACIGDLERAEKIAVEGNGLVYTLVSTTRAGATTPTAVNARYPLTLQGDKLIVQGTMVQQGQSRPVATVYTRSTDKLEPIVIPVFKGPAATIAQAEWIGTTWIGTTGTGNAQATVEERWTPPASGSMLGIGRTVRGTTLASFEFLCIVERNGTLVYQAMPSMRTPATNFTLTSATADSLTFENPSHDYPKLIRYSRLADGSLQTTISGGTGTRETSLVLKKQ